MPIPVIALAVRIINASAANKTHTWCLWSVRCCGGRSSTERRLPETNEEINSQTILVFNGAHYGLQIHLENQLIEFVIFVYDTVLIHADTGVTKNFREAKGHLDETKKKELVQKNLLKCKRKKVKLSEQLQQ